MNPWDSINLKDLQAQYTERFPGQTVPTTKRACWQALNPPAEPAPAEQAAPAVEAQQPTEPSPPAPDLLVTGGAPPTKVEAQQAGDALAEIERLRKALAEATARAATQIEPLKTKLADIESEITAAETALKSLRDQRDALRSQIASLGGKQVTGTSGGGNRGSSGITLEVNGVQYNSPTAAAMKVRSAHGALSAVNGNAFWGITGAEGDGFEGTKTYQGTTYRFRVIRKAAA